MSQLRLVDASERGDVRDREELRSPKSSRSKQMVSQMRKGRPALWGDDSKAHPLVQQLFRIMREQQASILDVQERAGFRIHTLRRWRTTSTPIVSSLEAVANVLGYRLMLVPIGSRRFGKRDDHAPVTHDSQSRLADGRAYIAPQQEERA